MLKLVIKERDNIIDELDRELLFENNEEGSKKGGSENSLVNEGGKSLNRYQMVRPSSEIPNFH